MPEASDLPDQREISGPPTTAEPPVEYDSVREALLSTVENQKLANHADQLYKPGATVGDGGTAAAVYQETETQEPVNGKWHHIKAEGHSNGLDRLDDDRAGLSLTDREIARDLKEDLDSALAQRQQTIEAATEKDYTQSLQAAYNQTPTSAEPPASAPEVSPAPEIAPEPTPASSIPPSQGG